VATTAALGAVRRGGDCRSGFAGDDRQLPGIGKRFLVQPRSIGTFGGFVRLFCFRPHDVDRGGIKVRLDVRRIVFLNHLDAGAAVFGDLVDVRAFHEAQANVCMPQAVSRAWPAIAKALAILTLGTRSRFWYQI
jgi:hypothetical protein